MDLLEYQGKLLFARHGVPVPSGRPARTVEEGVAAAEEIGYPCAVKAQVQIGGRGKLGGIKIAHDSAEAREHAGAILGMDIRGLTVYELWIEGASEIASEYYASVVFDRGAKAPLAKLYSAFVAEEATLVEVNPLIVTPDRQVRALDAKVTLDNNSLFRHPENAELRDLSAEDPQERMAHDRGLTYVKLDGNIGILGNGAGLVMSTLDVVQGAGGEPADFLDAGGGSKSEAIVSAVEVILSDSKVKAVLFNIFGGITRCDEVARGLIEAFRVIEPTVPFVVRLDGTNDKEGRAILAEANLPGVYPEATMDGAAAKVVQLATQPTSPR